MGPAPFRCCVALCCGVIAAGANATARAQDASPEAATADFDRGVLLFEKDDFVGAIEAFERADRAHHAATITYNIARTRESLGQAQLAYEAYEAYLAEAGAQAQYLDAATVALARIKARATRLRVETSPPGAAVHIDGILVRDKSPSTVLVFRGRHRVEVDWGGVFAARDIDAAGDGQPLSVSIAKPEMRNPAQPSPAPKAPSPRARPPQPEAGDMMAGAGFSLNYTALVVKEAPSAAARQDPNAPDYRNASLMFGAVIEAGYAFTPRSAIMARFHCGLGSTEKALFSLGAASLGYSWRASKRWWIGGGAIAGSSDKDIGATYNPLVGARSDDKIEFVSHVTVGPTLELRAILDDSDSGEWHLSMNPSLLLGTAQGQSTFYVPLWAGYRWY